MLKEIFIDDVKSCGREMQNSSLPVLMTLNGKIYSIWFDIEYRQLMEQPKIFVDTVFMKQLDSEVQLQIMSSQIDLEVELGTGEGMSEELALRISEELDSFGSWIDSLDEDELEYNCNSEERLRNILNRSDGADLRLSVDEYLEVCDSICEEFMKEDLGIFGDMTEDKANELLASLTGVTESVIIAEIYRYIQKMVYNCLNN